MQFGPHAEPATAGCTKPELVGIQVSETRAMTMTNAATEYTLPVLATSAVQISGVMPPKIAANW